MTTDTYSSQKVYFSQFIETKKHINFLVWTEATIFIYNTMKDILFEFLR